MLKPCLIPSAKRLLKNKKTAHATQAQSGPLILIGHALNNHSILRTTKTKCNKCS